jgi:hypothetical protein
MASAIARTSSGDGSNDGILDHERSQSSRWEPLISLSVPRRDRMHEVLRR